MKNKINLKINTPTIMVILGATGDLSHRKLIPALVDLQDKNALPDVFRVVGFSNSDIDDNGFKDLIKKSVENEKHKHTKSSIKKMQNISSYEQGDFTDINSFKNLQKALKKIDDSIGQCTNKLFYLAVPPVFYKDIFNNLSKSNLTKACSGKTGWTRVLVEKPFGRDISTAQKLDKLLDKLFREEQIFRIDHYLAKETVQNILSFRFSNSIFEPVWNNKYIEKVEISIFEKLDVGTRGSFYDGVGALRDVGQNHMLQLLALVAMENPGEIKSKLIRTQRAKLMKSLKSLSFKSINESVVRAQYEGFTKTKGVIAGSKTETYFKIKTFIESSRWKGVPFYLESGKALDKTGVDIKIYFKSPMKCFCPEVDEDHTHQNIISFQIQPKEGIDIRFWAKNPGLDMSISPKDLSFSYDEDLKNKLDAYEKVLFDCMAGDQTLFAGKEEIEASWKFITTILKDWQKSKLYKYKKGSMPKINN